MWLLHRWHNEIRVEVLAELHRALAQGPGVLVIKGGYADQEVIERNTAVFERIFAEGGYLAWRRPDFIDYFERHAVQLPMETVNRERILRHLYPALLARYRQDQLAEPELSALIAAAADGYSFPTNLNRDPPFGGLAPQTQQLLLRRALEEGWTEADFGRQLSLSQQKRQA